jgi:hypothetical protein
MAIALAAGLPRPIERRRFPRVAASANAESLRVRLLPGRDACLLNLSRSGALIQVDSRVLPDRPVEVQLSAPGWRWTCRARVLRCHVSALVREDGVRYHAALQFDAPMPADGPGGQRPVGPDARGEGYQLPEARAPKLPTRVAATRGLSAEPDRSAEMTGNHGTSVS